MALWRCGCMSFVVEKIQIENSSPNIKKLGFLTFLIRVNYSRFFLFIMLSSSEPLFIPNPTNDNTQFDAFAFQRYDRLVVQHHRGWLLRSLHNLLPVFGYQVPMTDSLYSITGAGCCDHFITCCLVQAYAVRSYYGRNGDGCWR